MEAREIQEIQVEHGEVPSEQDHREWRSCCLIIDKFMLQFIAQVLVCVLVILFCMFMLFEKDDCSDQQLYMSTLTLVLGVFVPHPRIH
jgi:hypothetical protein